VPVADKGACKSADQASASQSITDKRILIDIETIVVVKKIVADCPAKDEEGDRY
jgi:hypothetical protein